MVLVVRNHLVEVLGQPGGELLVPGEGALLVDDVGDGGDQHQLLLGVGLGEAVDTEGVQHHRGTSGLLVSQVPGNWRVFFSLSLYHSHGSDEEESLEGDSGDRVKVSSVGFHKLAECTQRKNLPCPMPILLLHGPDEELEREFGDDQRDGEGHLLEGQKPGPGHDDALEVVEVVGVDSSSQEGACWDSVSSRPAHSRMNFLLLKVFNLGNLHAEGSGEDDILVLHLVVVLEQAGGRH